MWNLPEEIRTRQYQVRSLSILDSPVRSNLNFDLERMEKLNVELDVKFRRQKKQLKDKLKC